MKERRTAGWPDPWLAVRPGAPMFIVGALTLVLQFFSRPLGLPEPTRLAIILGDWLASQGLWAVFAAYLIEGLFVLGFYFPGSFVLFTAALEAHSSGQFWAIWSVANVAAFLSLTLNYILGKWGLSHFLLRLWDGNQFASFGERARRLGAIAFFLAGFHIDWLAVLTTFNGSIGSRYWWTVRCALFSHACWSAFVLWLVSQAGRKAQEHPDAPIWLAALFILLGVAMCVRARLPQHGRAQQ